MHSWYFAALLIVVIALVCGCTRPPPPTRPADEIFAEQLELPAVYLTASGKRIEAAAGRGPFVDEKTREIAWRALTCNRPDCPGKKSANETVLFISPDSAMYVTPDGSIAVDPARAVPDALAGQCPECWKQRNPQAETSAQQQQFRDWVSTYELPETAKRMAELESERKRRVRRDQHQAISHE